MPDQEPGAVDPDPHISGPYLRVLEKFLCPGPVLGGGVGRKISLRSLPLKTSLLQEAESHPDRVSQIGWV